jgi:predicted RNase H-like HicB family nuclease
MTQRFYPAVMERGDNGVFAVWFPDFPGCVAAAVDEEQAIAKAQDALAGAVIALAEREGAIPSPTPMQAVRVPDGVEVVSLFAIGVTPPNPSERVNIYLPKALIERLDRRATALGMSRSSFVGFAVSRTLDEDRPVWLKAPVQAGRTSVKGRRKAGGR